MNRSRANRRRLAWCRYWLRAKKITRDNHHAGMLGLARVERPFYRNGARYPYGWIPL
jgi:hypothetical protein